MQDIIFDTVSDETTILAIGSLFRRGDNKQWGVNLDLTPKAETASLSLSNIPLDNIVSFFYLPFGAWIPFFVGQHLNAELLT
jgi:hypothetical protein